MYYDEEKQTLHVQPIEVKTRDESPDVVITVDEKTGDKHITGHAADQVASVVRMLREIFGLVETDALNMFVSARREVLKYQIVSECFRDIHDADWHGARFSRKLLLPQVRGTSKSIFPAYLSMSS